MAKRLRKSIKRLQRRTVGYDLAVAIAKNKTKAFNPASLKRPGGEKKRKGRG